MKVLLSLSFIMLFIVGPVFATPLSDSLNNLTATLDTLQSNIAIPPQPNQITFDELIKLSAFFNNKISKFPTQNNRIAVIAGNDNNKQRTIEQQAQTTYPVADKTILKLLQEFLDYKKQHGNSIEKKLYLAMDVDNFINRLLRQRPLMFMGDNDAYILRSGTKGVGGFEAIGTMQEISPLLLTDYLSYDEMQIAALLGVSVPTYFINNGNRANSSMPGKPGTFQEQGIYVGLVGARFEKPGLMEWQHMLVTPQQNTPENGYGVNAPPSLLSVWARFYGIEYFSTYKQAQEDTTKRFLKVENSHYTGTFYLDTLVYKERLKKVLKPFLLDAQQRGIANKKNVYIHAVGLGLGVWKIDYRQTNLMLDAYVELAQTLDLSKITDIDFSYFDLTEQKKNDIINNVSFKTKSPAIKIHFSQRNPADILEGQDAEKLLVAMYAWDGNAYPGNEYWGNMLTASGDPAAACCSTIAELQNPLINKFVSAKYMKSL